MAKFAYAALLGLLGVVIIHISTLLLIPVYTGTMLWQRLAREAPAYRFAPLPPANPIAKTADPLFALRLCRFDLAENPVRLTAEGNAPFWSLSVYSQKGENLYSINSSAAPGGALDIVAIDPLELMDFKHNLPPDYANSALVALNDGKNFAVLRALAPSADWRAQTEAFLAAAKCAPTEY